MKKLTKTVVITLLSTTCLTIAVVSTANALVFPTTGYSVIATDAPDSGVDPDRDITTVEYLQDGINCYFRFTVVNGTNWGVSFANERFFIYVDLNSDGNSDYLLYTDNPTKTKLMNWNTTQGKWVDTYSNTASSFDPNDNPDEHIYLGVALSDMGITDGLVIGASAGTANFKPTARNPQDETTFNDFTNPTPVGYGILSTSPVTASYTQSVAAIATLYDTSITTTTFKWYKPAGTLAQSQAVTVVNKLATHTSPVFASTDTGIWHITAEYRNSANTLLDSDTVSFQVIADDADGDGHQSSADCNDADPNNWVSCATCSDLDGDTRHANCDAYVTLIGPDCNDLNVNAWNTCATCVDSDADGYYLACNQYLAISGPDCDDSRIAVHPGATELCDGLDNDCNLAVDDGVPFSDYYSDIDLDTFGGAFLGSFCAPPAGGVLISGDCDDAVAAIFPGAIELCDSLDNQCAGDVGFGTIDEGCSTYWDSDLDGLPDTFEQAHISDAMPLDPNYGADGAMDFDGDGILNVHEYWNETDYKTPNPAGDVGCRYWGEGDGDGFISPGDVSILTSYMKGVSVSYNQVSPNNSETQELDMDLFRSPSDLSLLRAFIRSTNIAVLGSRPVAILVTYPLAPVTVAVGDTTHVTVSLSNSAGLATPGFGIGFELDPSSTGSVTMLGGESITATGRYDITGPIGPGGLSTMHFRVDSPGTIIIRAAIPECGADGVGRYCSNLEAMITLIGE